MTIYWAMRKNCICIVFTHWLETCSIIYRKHNYKNDQRGNIMKFIPKTRTLYPTQHQFQGRWSSAFQVEAGVNIYPNLMIYTIKKTVDDESTIQLPMPVEFRATLLLMGCRFHLPGQNVCICELRWGAPDRHSLGYATMTIVEFLGTNSPWAWKMAEISSESQFFFSGYIADMIPKSPLNKMVPLTDNHGWAAWGPPLTHGLQDLNNNRDDSIAKIP